tara:strand:+ start:10255 stop:10845 length:591 start_codon:yes stop_codon:yes gene_type:complete
MTLDKLTLDELVQGHDSDSETWQLLLKDSEREEMWDAAVKRREQLNRFCIFAVKWPGLAQKYKQLRSSIKKSIDSPNLILREVIPSNNPFLAVLSNQESSIVVSDLVEIDVFWGEQQIIELDEEKQIKFSIEKDLPIHYSYSEGAGWITTNDLWHFYPYEGAVMLTFIDGTRNEQDDLYSTTQQAKSISTVVLLPK